MSLTLNSKSVPQLLSTRKSKCIWSLSKQSYNNQILHSNQVRAAQVTMSLLIQIKVTLTMSELMTLKIVKVAEDVYELKFYSEAVHHLIHWHQWRLAINEKLNSLLTMSMFELCELSAFRNLIMSKWVFKVKYTLSKLVNQFKTHLVTHEFTQIEGVNYKEMFTLILHFESLRLLLFLTVELNFHI